MQSNRAPSSASPTQTTAYQSSQQTVPQQGRFAFSAPPPISIPPNAFAPVPDAPAYSPITPKVQPILPAPSSRYGAPAIIAPPGEAAEQYRPQQQQYHHNIEVTRQPPPAIAPATVIPPPAIAPATFIPPPPPLPFSSEDSTDAIALRAAISALQFQRKKAKDDLRSLDAIKKCAVENPDFFRDEVKAGRLKTQQPQFGGLSQILDREDSDDDDDDDSGEEDMSRMNTEDPQHHDPSAEIPDSQPSRPASAKNMKAAQQPKPPDFTKIPGPQNVVRMPNINWEKYHIVGAALDQLHEQQQRWPGSTFAYAGPEGRGREFAVAAPYSPFLDVLGDEARGTEEERKDSAAGALGSASEHPMETRRSSKNHP
ncbi:hypothetical protein LTR62_004999 [Meristemomyces frigidus]|uniref:Uncharacterized protein n=1 Tax=Meristemomyces frigidus TaxID=1508187 RepID=A0AAN7TN72_9PEZI|nr:hypothetical protein LTR62_004999 [Meristemomyces frigidus]